MVLYNKRKTFYKTVKNCNKKTIYNKIKDITIYNKKYITIYNKKKLYITMRYYVPSLKAMY